MKLNTLTRYEDGGGGREPARFYGLYSGLS